MNNDEWDILTKEDLPETYIEKLLTERKVRHVIVFKHRQVSERLIEKYKDMMHIWSTVSECQKLSEPFISKFADRVDWDKICMYQKLSNVFLQTHMHRINWGIINYRLLRNDKGVGFDA